MKHSLQGSRGARSLGGGGSVRADGDSRDCRSIRAPIC